MALCKEGMRRATGACLLGETRGNIEMQVVPVLFSIICYVGFLFSNPLYISSDNIGAAVVTNGYYGEDCFFQHIHPVLCIIIRLLHSLIPSSDSFTLLIHIIIIFQIGILFYLFTGDVFKKHIKKWEMGDYVKIMMVIMSILLFTSGICIWNTNYTITTGAIMLFGLVILFQSVHEQKGGFWGVAGTVFVSFGFMLRIESALLFIPYIILEIVSLIVDTVVADSNLKSDTTGNNKISHSAILPQYSQIITIKKMIYLVPCAVIVTVLFLSRMAFYNCEPYSSALRYNAARITLVDFPVKSWGEEVMEASEGSFSEADYRAVTNWCFFDTEYIDTDRLEKMAHAGAENQYELSFKGLKSIVHEMTAVLCHTSLYMVILIILSFVLAIRNIFCCSLWRKAETLLALLGSFIIIAYFTFRGRAPMRVWEPVIFASDFVLLCGALNHNNSICMSSGRFKKYLNRIAVVTLFSVLWFSTGQLLAYAQYHKPQLVLTSCIENDHSPYDPGTFYSDGSSKNQSDNNIVLIWPNWHGHVPEYIESVGKLPSQSVMEHNIPLGDWVYGQPYFMDLLDKIDVVNPARALLERPNTYLMEGSNETVLYYLREHFGPDIELQEVEEMGMIDDVRAYRVIRSGSSQ